MSGGVWRILLVENDEDDYILTRDLLSEIKGQRFEIQWISDYKAALDLALKDDIDVILVDYDLITFTS